MTSQAPPQGTEANTIVPTALIWTALILTVTLGSGVGWHTWSVYEEVTANHARYIRIQVLAGTITHLDEVLTMSARIGAITSDPRWEARYRQFAPRLDAAIQEIRTLAPDIYASDAAARTDAANVRLVEMETRAFALAHQGENASAAALMDGEDYREHKRLYAEGMERVTALLDRQMAVSQSEERGVVLRAVGLLLGSLALLTVVWFGLLRMMRRNVKERQRVRAALKMAEERLHMVVANAPIVLFAVDEAGIFILSEGQGLSALGLVPGEVVGRSVGELFRDVPAFVDHIRRAQEGEPVTAVVDVGAVSFDAHLIPLRNDQGEVIGVLGVATDTTARRRAEEDVRTLNQILCQRLTELDTMNAELTRANGDLMRKDEENAMFIYSVSHDLRSPLVNLQGFGSELHLVSRSLRSVLAEHDVPPALQRRVIPLLDGAMAESIRFIQSSVTRLSHIIDALLRLSRIGREDYQWQEVDVRSVVARVLDAMSGTIGDRQVEVAVSDLPPTWGDHTAIERVFANLIGNALNYLDPERPGRLEIGSRPGPGDGCPAYFVRDNGRGIPDRSRSKVFQAFQRFHTDVPSGEGIGLAIVHRIVERHGGKVWFESEERVGTTFLVTFPGRDARADAKRAA